MNFKDAVMNDLSDSEKDVIDKIDSSYWKAYQWITKYRLAKLYYKHYGNIDVPKDFKTKDGIERDANGTDLGKWIYGQKARIDKVSGVKAELLSDIGIMPKRSLSERKWLKYYSLAKAYYNKNGNLDIPFDYTVDGYNLGNWLFYQKECYRGIKSFGITDDKIVKLEDIGITWFSDNKDKELQSEVIDSNNINTKKIEINNRFNSILLSYNSSSLPSRDTIQNDFISKLDSYSKSLISRLGFSNLTELEKEYLLNNESKLYYASSWLKNYLLAKKNYEYFGKVKIPRNFVTVNGYTFDDNGVKLGDWYAYQKRRYNDNQLDKYEIELFKQINANLSVRKNEEVWQKFYNLAKLYYEHNGNLDVNYSFKTFDGYTYDSEGFALGTWVSRQRRTNDMKKERVKLLKEIGMIFKKHLSWSDYYNLAVIYYKHNGNLDIDSEFRTNDGYTFDYDGHPLGNWVKTQRRLIKNNKISGDRKEKLLSTFHSSNKDESIEKFNKYFNLVKNYYDNYGNLKIPRNFKTLDGITYDPNGLNIYNWVQNYKSAYLGNNRSTITDYKLKSFNLINMKWFSTSKDYKLQKEKITESNSKSKKIEVLNRFKSMLLNYNQEENIDSKKINDDFAKSLKIKY